MMTQTREILGKVALELLGAVVLYTGTIAGLAYGVAQAAGMV